MRRTALVLISIISVAPLAATPAPQFELITIPASVETDAVPGTGDVASDAADDAEIWRDANAPEQSRIIATDKKSGLLVFDLAGRQLQHFPIGRLNNVDLRDGWMSEDGSGGGRVLVAASDRTRMGVSFFVLDSETRLLSHLDEAFLPTDVSEPYGLCLYRSRRDGGVHVVVVGKEGDVAQYRLEPRAGGGLTGALVRRFTVGSISEGCVADDRTGQLYVGEENLGIWRYGAEPSDGDARQLVAAVDGQMLVADVEGLTILPSGDDAGHLIASSQGNSTFVVFSLPSLQLAGRFQVGANAAAGIDEVTHTDGVAAAAGSFGAAFPDGLVVMQDDENPGAGQNFKLVSFALIRPRLRQR